MLARWWLFFFAIVITVFGIAELVLAGNTPAATGTLVATGVIWLATALVAFYLAIFVTNLIWVRLSAAIIGVLYLAWGIVYLYVFPQYATLLGATVTAAMSAVLILLGANGIAAALVPAYWLYHWDESYYVGRS